MFKILSSIAFMQSPFLGIACSMAIASTITTFVANANSVIDTKTKIRETIDVWDGDNCFGLCSTSRGFDVCRLAKDLDRQVGGKITGRAAKPKFKSLSIGRSDLELMRLISSQCQPFKGELPPALKSIDIKNSKYFSPSCQALPKIRQGLELERFGSQHYQNNCLPKN